MTEIQPIVPTLACATTTAESESAAKRCYGSFGCLRQIIRVFDDNRLHRRGG